jgi:hypothetical protein
MQPLQEPLMTWNFFLTLLLMPLCVVLLGSYINQKMKKYNEEKNDKDNTIAKLLTDKEAKKEAEIREWRETYTRNQCEIKIAVADIRESLHKMDNGKVDWEAWRNKEDACKAEHRRIDDRFMAWDK